MMQTTETNKLIVRRFNTEFVEQGDLAVFHELVAPDCIHHTAPEGVTKDPRGMLFFFNGYLRPAFPDLKVQIHDQIAEEDKVVTYKSFQGTHLGTLSDWEATGRWVVIEVAEITRLRAGKIVEQWNVMDLQAALALGAEQVKNSIY